MNQLLMLKRSLTSWFFIGSILASNAIFAAESAPAAIAKYLLKVYPESTKQIEIQALLFSKPEFKQQLLQPEGRSRYPRAEEYIVSKAFAANDTSWDGNLKSLYSLVGSKSIVNPWNSSKNIRAPGQPHMLNTSLYCVVPYSPHILGSLISFVPMSEQEILYVTEAFDKYSPLFGAMATEMVGSLGWKVNAGGPDQSGNVQGLLVGHSASLDESCRAKNTDLRSFFRYLFDQKLIYGWPVHSTDDQVLMELPPSQLELLKRQALFYLEHEDVFNAYSSKGGRWDGEYALEKLNRVIEQKSKNSGLKDLLAPSENSKEDKGSELSLDNLKL